MIDSAYNLVEKAKEFRNSGELLRAGDMYTAAAHEYAGTVTGHSFPAPDNTNGAVSRLRYAATCYRLRGDEYRVQNRCELGTLLADDYLTYIDSLEFAPGSFADLRRGAWPEFIGDLRTIAQRDDAADAYDQARSIYASAGEWEFVLGEQEHMRLAGFFRNVRTGLGHDIPADAIEEQAPGPTFVDWIDYKRDRLPELLDQLEKQGEWPSEQ